MNHTRGQPRKAQEFWSLLWSWNLAGKLGMAGMVLELGPYNFSDSRLSPFWI